ncbi:nicotinamide riboside transporter PnuC [Celerinatantimonas yamalensis]|uniref:Nicotinamide riboside transporter PnuC n=1 Tax=Celerinatantimonas yamalensis TaxID=559956 RepID=A0ABW9G634_9GAMM
MNATLRAFNPKLVISDFIDLTGKQKLTLLILCLAVMMPSIIDGSLLHLTSLGLVYILAGLTGIICVFLINMRKLSNFQFGLVNAFLYGAAAYYSTYYGDAALNFLVYFPFQFIGAYWWSRHMQSSEVKVQGLTLRQSVIYLVLMGLSIAIYGFYLVRYTNDAMPYVDSATNVISIFAMILMVKGYWEQWLGWIVVNILSIWMWVVAGEFNPQAYAVLVMWVAYLGNSLYGTYNWYRSIELPSNRAH